MHGSCSGRWCHPDWGHAQHSSSSHRQRQPFPCPECEREMSLSLSLSLTNTHTHTHTHTHTLSLSLSLPPSPSLPLPPSLCQCARAGARCDYGLYVGAAEGNATSLPLLAPQALAMKMYLNTTFSTLQLGSMETWMKVGVFLLCWRANSLVLSLSLCSTLTSGPRAAHSVCMLRDRRWRLYCCWQISTRGRFTSVTWPAVRRLAVADNGHSRRWLQW